MRDPEKVRAAKRRYRERHYEQVKAESRARYAANREQYRAYGVAYRARNADQIRARQATYRAVNRDRAREYALWKMHRMRPDQWSAIYEIQGGCCYLCGDQLDPEKAHVDHDHRCCPRNQSCPNCRRGLACGPCNTAIGLAQDDPARLRRMAEQLEIAQKRFSDRQELCLFEVPS